MNNEALNPIGGFLQVGVTNDLQQVVLNHPQLLVDEHGQGYILFSPAQARHLAALLWKQANICEMETAVRHSDEFDCVDCGRHIVRMILFAGEDGRRCAHCMHMPGWHRDPNIAKLLDPDYEVRRD
jgi:hypothetical protein